MSEALISKKSIDLNAPVSKVWKIITTDDTVSTFMLGMKPLTDWKKGSPINWIGRHEGEEHNMAKGSITEVIQNKKLAYTFFYGGYGHADIPEHYQTIILELEAIDATHTKLTAQQGDYAVFEDGKIYLQHANDFWEQAIKKIKELSESIN